MKAVYLLNRLPTRSLDGKMPHEAWYNKKPAVHHLRVFGCVAYMKVMRSYLAKLTCCATSSLMRTPSSSGTT